METKDIKFKAYHKQFNIIGVVLQINFVNMVLIVKTDIGDIVTWFLQNCELLQYTGYKDKNGIEIYRGDTDGEKTVDLNNASSWQLSPSKAVLNPEYLFLYTNSGKFEVNGNSFIKASK